MIRETVWSHSANRVSNYLQDYVTLAGAEKKEEVLGIFQNIHLLFPQWCIMSCPMMHPDLHYASRNCSSVFGHSNEYMMDNRKGERYFSHVHDDDQQYLYNCYSFLYDYMESISPEEHHVFRAMIYYRFRKPNGQYIHLHDEKASLRLQDSGNFYYGLFQDVSASRPFTGVKIELYRQEKMLKKIKEFKPSAQRALSKREQELVSFMRQGLSNKEIAWHLNISPHTVRNIKSK